MIPLIALPYYRALLSSRAILGEHCPSDPQILPRGRCLLDPSVGSWQLRRGPCTLGSFCAPNPWPTRAFAGPSWAAAERCTPGNMARLGAPPTQPGIWGAEAPQGAARSAALQAAQRRAQGAAPPRRIRRVQGAALSGQPFNSVWPYDKVDADEL